MASQNGNNADLVTDACPSPPREDKDPSPSEFKDEEKPESASYTRHKPRKHKPKKSSAVANFININNSNGIHIGANYTINMTKSQKNEEPDKEEVIKTEAICEILQRTDLVTTEIISFVSEHIGKNWRVVARTLGYSDGQIHQYYEKNFVSGIREVVYQILLDWIQNQPEEAKVGVLCTALWNAPEKQVVQRVVDRLHIK